VHELSHDKNIEEGEALSIEAIGDLLEVTSELEDEQKKRYAITIKKYVFLTNHRHLQLQAQDSF
jgi:hypothetical protein